MVCLFVYYEYSDSLATVRAAAQQLTEIKEIIVLRTENGQERTPGAKGHSEDDRQATIRHMKSSDIRD